MAKDVDLNSKQWLDLVFEDRNKEFGAYELRESSSQRHILAVGVVVMAGFALVFLPKLITQPAPLTVAPFTQQTDVQFTAVDNLIAPEKMPEKVEDVSASTAPAQRTVAFTEPVVVVDEAVRPENLMPNQDDLTQSDAAIGRENVEGEIVGRHPDTPVGILTDTPVETSDGPTLTPDVQAIFDGNLQRWLSSNIRYPVDAIETGIEGRVVLRFVVQTDGKIGSVEVLRKLSPSCDREAVQVVKKMPKWIPGQKDGQAVASYFTLPVLFKLQK